MPRKVFTAGEVLAAADVNEFLMDQTIMTFAGTAARGSAIGTAVEGMYAHLNDTDTLTYYDGSDWVNRIPASGILQVVSVTKTDTFLTASTTFTDITGFSASITPTSASSKVLILASLNIGAGSAPITGINLVRGSTSIGQADAAGSRTRAIAAPRPDSNFQIIPTIVNFLDSPATTSATTYKFQMLTTSSTAYLNKTQDDTDVAGLLRTSSTITLMEVAG